MSVLGQQLIESVRAHAADKPDFIYESPLDDGPCVYIHNGCPSCLIGHALFDAGVIDASIENTPANHDTVTSISDNLALPVDFGEISWLRNVQYAQDSQRSWGAAVAEADNLG